MRGLAIFTGLALFLTRVNRYLEKDQLPRSHLNYKSII